MILTYHKIRVQRLFATHHNVALSDVNAFCEFLLLSYPFALVWTHLTPVEPSSEQQTLCGKSAAALTKMQRLTVWLTSTSRKTCR